MSSREGSSAQLSVEIQSPVERQLPVEIWQHAAGHMSSRDWARVSRTCRAMHSVQPKKVDISVGSESPMAWVQTHWGQASSLKLTCLKTNIPWVMAHNAVTVTALNRLELSLLQEGSPDTAIMLTWLLAITPQLQLLSLEHPRAFVVPPIRNLSHLILASNGFTPTCAASIGQLRNLQTLWLGTSGPLPLTACAGFDLASLPQLSDVCVDGLVQMPSFNMPEQCRLHLVGRKLNMFLETWSGIARLGQLQSIDMRSNTQSAPPSHIEVMPQFVLESKCSILDWRDMARLGDLMSPVLFDAAQFTCLTHLRLQGRDIHIVLPEDLLLQVLHVCATVSLSIVCVNPQEQAKRLQQMAVAYCTLRGVDIFDLVAVMCSMGAVLSERFSIQAENEINRQHGFLVTSPHAPGEWKCPCSACLPCLQEI